MIIKNEFSKRVSFRITSDPTETLEYDLFDSFILRLRKYIPVRVDKTEQTLADPDRTVTVSAGFVAMNRKDYAEVKFLIDKLVVTEEQRETYKRIIAIMEQEMF